MVAPRGSTSSLERMMPEMTQWPLSGRSLMARPMAWAPGAIFSSTNEYLPRRSLSMVIMSPIDISSSISLAMTSAWLRATSTPKSGLKSQALRGLLTRPMMRRTPN